MLILIQTYDKYWTECSTEAWRWSPSRFWTEPTEKHLDFLNIFFLSFFFLWFKQALKVTDLGNFVPYQEQLQWRLVLTLQCCHTNCDLQKIWRKKIVDIIFSSKLGSICWYIYIIGGKHCDKSCSVLSKCFVTNLFHFRAMHNKSQHLQSYTDVQLGGEGTHCPCEKKKHNNLINNFAVILPLSQV